MSSNSLKNHIETRAAFKQIYLCLEVVNLLLLLFNVLLVLQGQGISFSRLSRHRIFQLQIIETLNQVNDGCYRQKN